MGDSECVIFPQDTIFPFKVHISWFLIFDSNKTILSLNVVEIN